MRKLIRAGLALAFCGLACQTPRWQALLSSERLTIENQNQSLKELAASAGFDEVWPPGILDKITWVDQAKEIQQIEVNYQLISLGVTATSAEALAKLSALDQRSGTFPELIALAKASPTRQLEFPIIALGSQFIDIRGADRVPYIFKDNDNKRVLFFVVTTEWGEDCRFLAVPKHHTR